MLYNIISGNLIEKSVPSATSTLQITPHRLTPKPLKYTLLQILQPIAGLPLSKQRRKNAQRTPEEHPKRTQRTGKERPKPNPHHRITITYP